MELEVMSNRVYYTYQDELASQCKIILKPLMVVAEQEQILFFLPKEVLVFPIMSFKAGEEVSCFSKSSQFSWLTTLGTASPF